MQQPMMQQPMKKSRPTGVTILAVLNLLGGLFLLVTGGLAVLGGGAVASVAVDPSLTAGLDPEAAAALAAAGGASALGGALVIIGAIAAISGLIDIIAAIGLFGLKKWGLTLAIVGQLLSIGSTVYGMTQGQPLNVVGLALPVLILLYLFQPSIKQAFN